MNRADAELEADKREHAVIVNFLRVVLADGAKTDVRRVPRVKLHKQPNGHTTGRHVLKPKTCEGCKRKYQPASGRQKWCGAKCRKASKGK